MDTKLRKRKEKRNKRRVVTATELKEMFTSKQLKKFEPRAAKAGKLIAETISDWIAQDIEEVVNGIETQARKFPGTVILQQMSQELVIIVHIIDLEKEGAHSYIEKLDERTSVVTGSFQRELAKFILPALKFNLDALFLLIAEDINSGIEYDRIDANDENALKEEVLLDMNTIDELHYDWIPEHRFDLQGN